ncbi:MAG: NAD(P)H-dependent oxidoreductase subunit E [Deltaproteobacteria bacterium]|nr:MAG: NAD(P)H-dependent oxidoreductase subunit E [Deltaproteobacteria bacterium]
MAKKKVSTAATGSSKIDKIIAKYQGDAGSLIQVLLEIQRENRWLSKEALEKVSKQLKVPLNRIQHIVTFYKAFSLVPRGRHEVHVCTGTACHVRGAPRLLDSVQDLIGIRPGETDMDSKFSLETVNCLGCCALGPVIVIDGEYHGKMAPAKSEEVLKNYE